MITKKNKLDARKRSEYDVERFSVCERLAWGYLSEKRKKKSFRFSCFIYNPEKKEMCGPLSFRFCLSDEEYVFLLALQLSEHQGFSYNRLFPINPDIATRLTHCVEITFLEIENQFNSTQPFTIIFDELIEDANHLKEERDEALSEDDMTDAEEADDTTKKYTFQIEIFYTYTSEKRKVEIELTDDDVEQIKQLISENKEPKADLLHILYEEDDDLFEKFSDVIYPIVYIEELIYGFEYSSVEGVEKAENDPYDDYLDLRDAPFEEVYDLYCDQMDISLSELENYCKCEIPKEWLSK